MRKRLATLLIGIAVIGVVAVSFAGDHPDTVPIEHRGESTDAGCCCGGTVDGCTDDCADCGAECSCDSCGCDSDSCSCDTDAGCGCDSPAGADCSDDHLHSGCGGCR